MSIRWHLLGLVLAALVPVLVFSGAMMVRLGEQERAAHETQIADRAAIIADDVDTELRRSIAALEVLAVSNALATDDFATFHALAGRAVERQQWANVVLASVTGEHLLNLRVPYGSRLPRFNRPDLFVEVARWGRPRVSDVVPGMLSERSLTVIAVPVFREERVKYVLAAALAAPGWESFLRSRLGPGMQALLIDREMAIIARTLGGEGFVGLKPVRELVDAVARSPEKGSSRGMSLEGVQSYAAYRRAPLSGWTVTVFMPIDEIDAPVRGSLWTLGAGFLPLLGLGLLLAWFLARRIAGSIGQLTASVRSVGAGGAPLPVDTRIVELEGAGRALRHAAALLAERLDRQKSARAELEAADRAKDAFLAMLGHELRNPLAPIGASLYILEGEERSAEAAVRARAVIARQVRHLNRLVDDLLDVTRIASGKVELRRSRVSLNDLARRAAEDHAELARNSRIDLRLELPEEEIAVRGDPTRLAQIVGNLLQNAVKFTAAGGAVMLVLARRGEAAEIRVRDTGAGMDADLLRRLFQPFVQGRHAPARAGGLGLGLALARGLAELHGGTLQASSAGSGQGSEFVLTLPADAR